MKIKLNIGPLNSWFGFTRRERRSSFILLVLIVIIMAARYIVPERKIAIVDITGNLSAFTSRSATDAGEVRSSDQPFPFDPNKVSYDSLLKLGFTSKEANTLISYRTKGGKFRNPTDIKKIFGIDEAKVVKLIRYVKVGNVTGVPEKAANVSYRQQRPKLEINSCDSASLDALPGIGPVLSARIIKYRHLIGGFVRIDQLKEVYGLAPETFDLIKGRIYADSLAVNRININTAGSKELSGLPYFEKYEIAAILKYRELNVRINGITELVDNKLITREKANKVSSYLSFQ